LVVGRTWGQYEPKSDSGHRAERWVGQVPADEARSGFELHLETTMLTEIVAFWWRAEIVAAHKEAREKDELEDLRRRKEDNEEASKTTHELRRADSVYSPERMAPKKPREKIARQRARRT